MDSNTKEDFQSAIRAELRKSGIVRCVTTELRRQICDTINQSNLPTNQRSNGYNLEQAAIRSLVMEYLIYDKLDKTASVLSSESCLDDHILSRGDALKSYSVMSNSSIHSMLMRGSNRSIQCYENTCIHILLTHFAQLSRDMKKQSVHTQTALLEDDFQARKHLDTQLELINEKFRSSASILEDKRHFEQKMESRIQSIQRECEELARSEMEAKIKEYKSKTMLSMKKDEEAKRQNEILEMQMKLKQDYDSKYQNILDRENHVKKVHNTKELELESKVLDAQKKLANQVEKFKYEEQKMRNELELERKKIKIEEDRLKILSTTVAAKLEFAEKKELSMKKHLEAEYERIRSTAKQAFHDASETVRTQSDIYSKELKELNCKCFYSEHNPYSIIVSTSQSLTVMLF